VSATLATAVVILNIEGTVHMGNIFKDMLDAFSTPAEPVKEQPKSKGLGAKASMFIEDPGREAEKAEQTKKATGGSTATVAKMYTNIVREQNKDDTGNTPVVTTKSVAYSPASDDARDISNQGYYPDKIIRDSVRSGRLSSATPRRDVTKEALDDIETMIEKYRSKATSSYGYTVPKVETTYLDDYVDETERATTTKDEPASLSFYERYIAPPKTGLGVDPLRLARPPKDFLPILTQRLRNEEKFKDTAYRATKGEKYLTIGYGHYNKNVKPNQKITKEDAENLLQKDISDRLVAIRKAIPSFDNLSTKLQVEIGQSWFRGGMSGSPKTITLINAGDFEAAAKEFLNNYEYKNARSLGRAGIIPRMNAVAAALKNEEV